MRKTPSATYLIAADILQVAIIDALCSKSPKTMDEAKAWLLDDTPGVMSFYQICKILSIDANQLRNTLSEALGLPETLVPLAELMLPLAHEEVSNSKRPSQTPKGDNKLH